MYTSEQNIELRPLATSAIPRDAVRNFVSKIYIVADSFLISLHFEFTCILLK